MNTDKTTITEKPILFSAPMVRAILEGRKTQTRRVLKVQPASVEYWLHGERSDRMNGLPVMRDATGKGWSSCGAFRCPYIGEGMCATERGVLVNNNTEDLTDRRSRLWVKETFRPASKKHPRVRVEYRADMSSWGIADSLNVSTNEFVPDAKMFGGRARENTNDHWKPSIFMPRWASRITLEIESVRVERLQEISEADALAEGLYPNPKYTHANLFTWDGVQGNSNNPVYAYQLLWESINGAESWAKNPWVWVVNFQKVEGSKLQVAGSTRGESSVGLAINQ